MYMLLMLYPRRDSWGISDIPPRHPRFTQIRNTADVTGGKPIRVESQSISGANAVNLLVAFYHIHGGKREVLFCYFVPDTTWDLIKYNIKSYSKHTYISLTLYPQRGSRGISDIIANKTLKIYLNKTNICNIIPVFCENF
jgi:hypothetical protein